MGINPWDYQWQNIVKNLDQKLSLSATSQHYVISGTEKKSNHIVSSGALENFFHLFSMATGRFLKLILLVFSIPTDNHGIFNTFADNGELLQHNNPGYFL